MPLFGATILRQFSVCLHAHITPTYGYYCTLKRYKEICINAKCLVVLDTLRSWTLSTSRSLPPKASERTQTQFGCICVYALMNVYCAISLFNLVNSMKIRDVFYLFDPKRHHRTKDTMLSWHFIIVVWPPNCSLQRDCFHFHYYWVPSGSRYTIVVQLYHVLPSYCLTFSPCPLCSICKHWVSCHCVSMMLGFCS